jgi:hypothetical protein
MALIGPEHPDYLELFYAGFGSGGSYPARLIKDPQKVAVKESSTPPPVQGPSSPSHEHQEDPRSDKS